MGWKSKEYWLVLSLIGATAAYSSLLRSHHVKVTEPVDFSQIPYTVKDWVARESTLSESVIEILKAERTCLREYVNSKGTEIRLFIAYWDSQKYGAQPHSPLHCLPGSGWNFLSKDFIPVAFEASENTNKANFAIIANGRNEEGMLYWYQTRSEVLSSEFRVKLSLAKNAILRKPTDVAFIRITTPVVFDDRGQTLSIMQDFWTEVCPQVSASLPF